MKNKFRFVNIRASRRSFIPSILSAAVAFALASNQAQAQTRVWNGTVANLTNGAWGTSGAEHLNKSFRCLVCVARADA